MAIDFIDPTVVPFVSTFLLVFALVFGLLSYSKTLNFDKRVNALIALSIALFSVFYPPLVQSLYQFMPVVAVIFIFLFFIAFLMKIFEGGKEGKKTTFPMIVIMSVLLLVLGISADRLKPFIPDGIDTTNVLWGIGIIVVLMILWGVYGYEGKGVE